MTQTYRMDDATREHLAAWCARNCREEDAEQTFDRIVAHLEALDAEDAEYSLSHGWQHILNLL